MRFQGKVPFCSLISQFCLLATVKIMVGRLFSQQERAFLMQTYNQTQNNYMEDSGSATIK